jgi:dihydroxyacetone kinase
MTRLFNDPADFTDEMIDGFVAANAQWVRRVHGGVVRSTRSLPGTVAIVTGGGSGHYPAFGGLVGPGLAHGAALGNVFASPSWQQVRSVARSADTGGGVVLTFGNYAGDVLNFTNAQTKLALEGIESRIVAVTDDISSAPRAEKHKRRGIAGDLTVMKSLAAASELGFSLDEVYRVGMKANERTRSVGIAFSGCTLPGSPTPLFSVPEGRMAVGMGIHGEPGIDEAPVPSAAGLAELLVSALLEELPAGVSAASGQRVVALLNGLGSVKYEVNKLLTGAGITVIEPEVGELVTSFDMAGVSLTLFWLDDELEELWCAPCSTPGFKKGSIGAVEHDFVDDVKTVAAERIPAASKQSQEAAVLVLESLEQVKKVLDDNAVELGRIDSVAGDGDHGIGMQRGIHAAVVAAQLAVDHGAGAGTVLAHAGDAWSDRAGGTSGALWGAALDALGEELTDTARPNGVSVASGVEAAKTAILEFGAHIGDKTMVDALVPFADSLSDAVHRGDSLLDAWTRASFVATAAAAATADLLPRMGRARPHAHKSVGTPDAGATSFALITDAVATVLRNHFPKGSAQKDEA